MSDRIDELEAAVAEQRTLIAELRSELDRLTGPGAPSGQDPRKAHPAPVEQPVTDRRGLLRQAGAAAAGAVAGAVVLGSTSPAAAATSDTGNPAILGTASPTSGIGVQGVTQSGTGVDGRANATSGLNVNGVSGRSKSTSGRGVIGVAEASSGTTEGVRGVTLSPNGVGVFGLAGAAGGGTGVLGAAGTATGVGVHGNSNHASGTVSGVYGDVTSTNGRGVRGYASAATGTTAGVSGEAVSPSGAGVHAASNNGTGLVAHSGRTQVRFSGAPAVPPNAGMARVRGEMVFDTNGDLWFCVANGTPGTWRKLSGLSTAGAFHASATPTRVYDSRPGFSPGTGPKSPLAAATPRTLDLKGSGSGVPAGAVGVLVNLVATGTTTGVGGYLTIYRNGISWPGTSNLNWSGPGQTVAVTTITAVDASGLCRLYAGSVTDVVVDVLGYYR